MDIMEPGYKMLGSTGTQYLNPDYIQPLPTTLDSKNSPLALLAQTCSSIGKDCSSTPKLSLPSLTDKKDQRGDNGPKDAGSSSSSSSASSSRHRSTSDSPLIGSSSVCGSSRSGGEGTRSNRTGGGGGGGGGGGKSSVKDCSSSRSSSSDAVGGRGATMMTTGDENSPKARGVHSSSSRPLSSTVGSGSGRCTPSSAIITSGGSLHRDFASLRPSASSSSSSGLSFPSSSAINNSKLLVGEGGGMMFDSYPEEFLKTSAGLLHQSQSLQEALRLQHEGLQSLQSGVLGPLPSAYPPLLFGHPLTAAALDPLMYSYSASLAAVHGLALNSHKLPTLSPYMGYARVSTAGGGSTLVPVCKDPYCTTGSIPHPPPPPSLHSPAAGGGGASCGSGCSQCGGGGGHDKTHRCTGGGLRPATTTLSANGALGAPPGGGDVGQFSSPLYPLSLPGGGGLVNPGLLGMAAAAQLHGVGLTPYACSWLASGGEFCGKRFSKADDLLQHLRTHASSGDPAALPPPPPGFPPLPPGMGPLPTPGFGSGHPFSIPSGGGGGGSSSSLSPGSLLQQAVIAAAAAAGQAYPRSLSPTTTALLNASRYHPYKSPFAAVLPPGTGSSLSSTGSGGVGLTPGGAASALDAYYSSPYALFGHRIGAAAVGP